MVARKLAVSLSYRVARRRQSPSTACKAGAQDRLEAAEHVFDGIAALVEGLAAAAYPAPVMLGAGYWGPRPVPRSDRGCGCCHRRDRRGRCSGEATSTAGAQLPGIRRLALVSAGEASGRPWQSVMAWTLVLGPPQLTLIAWQCTPFSARCGTVRQTPLEARCTLRL